MNRLGFRLFLYSLFTVSGFAALVYQVVWQRSLYAIYGINVESVTMIVSAFMLGLGLGSLGWWRGVERSEAPDVASLRHRRIRNRRCSAIFRSISSRRSAAQRSE